LETNLPVRKQMSGSISRRTENSGQESINTQPHCKLHR
jgi:hypothetical protein